MGILENGCLANSDKRAGKGHPPKKTIEGGISCCGEDNRAYAGGTVSTFGERTSRET